MSATKSSTRNNVPTCQPAHPIEVAGIEELRQKTLDIAIAQNMAEFFRSLGDANRLRILSVLAEKEMCVCDLAVILEMSESAVSHQLRTLRSLKLVGYQKQGRRVYYHILNRHILNLYQLINPN